MVNSYELNIISRDEISNGKTLKQYDLDGEKIVGCYENEQFAILFKNNTWNRVAIKLSLDGTDIITGKLADTNNIGNMWICEPMGKLELQAFPETNKGGAEFLFGKTENSVAVNTHGVKTGIGYIAAAVFVEEFINLTYPIQTWCEPIPFNQPFVINQWETTCNSATQSFATTSIKTTLGPAICAGDYVNQEIKKVVGLNKPILATTICVKYEWWTSLRSKIRKSIENLKPINPAFPGDGTIKMLDLKSTPKGRKNKKINKDKKYPELNRFC